MTSSVPMSVTCRAASGGKIELRVSLKTLLSDRFPLLAARFLGRTLGDDEVAKLRKKAKPVQRQSHEKMFNNKRLAI